MSEFTFVMEDGQKLKHHGILGMKWGQRNGPPYPLDNAQKSSAEIRAGRGVHNKDSVYYKEAQKAKQKRNETVTAGVKTVKETNQNVNNATRSAANVVKKTSKSTAKPAKEMTDAELREVVNRLNLEQQYNNLTANDISAGKKEALRIMDIAGDVVSFAGSAAALYLTLKKITT